MGDLDSIPGRRERLPTTVFWPGEFHGLCSPWGHKESDMTERLSLHFTSLYRIPGSRIEINDVWKKQDSLVAQAVKNLPAVQEPWVRSLGEEDP